MIVCHQYRYIFLKTSKTAGSSIEMALSRWCGPDDIVTKLKDEEEVARRELGHRGWQNDRWPIARCGWRQWRRLLRGHREVKDHCQARDARRLVGDEIWNSYFKFCFVRNPWDRVISQWFWVNRRKPEQRPTLAALLESKHMRNLHMRGFEVYTVRGTPVVDRICRYEDLANEMEAVRQRIGLTEPVVLPRLKGVQRTDRRPYQDWYDDATRDQVAQLFAREIQLFGYEFAPRSATAPVAGGG